MIELLAITIISEDKMLKGGRPSVVFTADGKFARRFDLPAFVIEHECAYTNLILDSYGCDGALPDSAIGTIFITDKPEVLGDPITIFLTVQ